MKEYVFIGKIVGTHGIKGEFRIISNFELKEKVFLVGNDIYIGNNYTKYSILTYRHHKNYEMITVNDIKDINEALLLKGLNVYYKRSDLNLNKDDYIVFDLLNLTVLDDNDNLGTIVDIVDNNGNVLLKVEGENNFYIPYSKEYIKSVDIDNKIVKTNNAKDLIL